MDPVTTAMHRTCDLLGKWSLGTACHLLEIWSHLPRNCPAISNKTMTDLLQYCLDEYACILLNPSPNHPSIAGSTYLTKYTEIQSLYNCYEPKNQTWESSGWESPDNPGWLIWNGWLMDMGPWVSGPWENGWETSYKARIRFTHPFVCELAAIT